MTAKAPSSAPVHAGHESAFDSTRQPSDNQAPMQLAACEAYAPGSKANLNNDTSKNSCNESMGDQRLQEFLDTNLAPLELYSSCSNSGDRSNHGQDNRTEDGPSSGGDHCHTPGDNRGNSGSDTSPRERHHHRHDRGSDNTLPRDRNDGDGDHGRYSRDDCHTPRDTHTPHDTTDVPGNTPSERCPNDRVVIEPCKDMPKPPLNPGEFLVVVINVSADQMDRAGDFIGRLLGNAFNRDSNSGSSRGGYNGFHLDGIPSPENFFDRIFGGGDGRNGGPGDILSGLPGVGELFGGGDDSQSGSGNGLPRPSDVLGSLPGLGNLFGGGGNNGRGRFPLPGLDGLPGGNGFDLIPDPQDIIDNVPGLGLGFGPGSDSGIPSPEDILRGGLPQLPGLPGLGGGGQRSGFMNPIKLLQEFPGPTALFDSLPSPGDLPGIGDLPLPGLGGDGKIPMPHEIVEDAVSKPLKSIKNLFKKIF